MGAYLSQPRTEKVSSDEENEILLCGASSMQGWRMDQEDAHNCCLDFDKDTAYFAVYDGHGGAEIALYCSKYLPDFLKKTSAYCKGDFETALVEAFLGFDEKLLEKDVIRELKVLGDKMDVEDEEGETDDEEDLAELRQEGRMPLKEVLEKYKEGVQNSQLERVKEAAAAAGSSKPQSPCLRAKKRGDEEAGSSSTSTAPACSSSSIDEESEKTGLKKKKIESDSTVSSSCSKSDTSSSVDNSSEAAPAPASSKTEPPLTPQQEVKNNGVVESPDSSSGSAAKAVVKKADESPGSSSDKPAVTTPQSESSSSLSTSEAQITNGKSTSAEPSGSGGVSSSCSSTATDSTPAPSMPIVENGESSSSSSVNISSTNNDRAAKRRAHALNQIQADEDDTETEDEDDKDATYKAKSNKEGGDRKFAETNSDDEDDDEEVEGGDEDESGEDYDDEMNEEEVEEEDDEEADEWETLAMEGDHDGFLKNMVEEPGKDSGCTAIAALLRNQDLYVANVGDSRCVLCRRGLAVDMSIDHKPEDLEEYNRILEAGGRVTADGRVNGGLNLSRAIGDHAYKMKHDLPPEKQMISAKPDIKKIELNAADEFLVLACDGIWNSMSSQAVVGFVKTRINNGEQTMSKICEELFDACLAKDTSGDGTGCDNMTAIIVKFKKSPLEFGRIEVEAVGSKRAGSPLDASSSSEQQSSEAQSVDSATTTQVKRIKTDIEDGNVPSTTTTTTTQSSSSTAEDLV